MNDLSSKIFTWILRVHHSIAFQLRLNPGQEFVNAFEEANRQRIPVYPIDILDSITIAKIKAMGPYHLFDLNYDLIRSLTRKQTRDIIEMIPDILIATNQGKTISIEKQNTLKDYIYSDQIPFLPSFNKTLLEDRNQYMASKLRQLPHKSIIGVFGESHIEGIIKHIEDKVPNEEEYQKKLLEIEYFNWKKFWGMSILGAGGSVYVLRKTYHPIMKYIFLAGSGGVTYMVWKGYTIVQPFIQSINEVEKSLQNKRQQ